MPPQHYQLARPPVLQEATLVGAQDAAELVPTLLSEGDILRIRALIRPPPVVVRLLEAVYWLLMAPRLRGRAPTLEVKWSRVQAMLQSPGFRDALHTYDVAAIREAPLVLRHLRARYFGPDAPGGALRPHPVRRASISASVLFEWATAVLERAEARPAGAAPASRRPPSPIASPKRAASPCCPAPASGSAPSSGIRLPLLPSPRPPSAGGAGASPFCERPGSGSSPMAALRQAGSAAVSLSCRSPDARSPMDDGREMLRCFRRNASPRRANQRGASPLLRRGLSPMSRPPQQMKLCKSDPVLSRSSGPGAYPASLRTIVVAAGVCRAVSRLVARCLLEWPHTLVVLLVHGAEAAAAAQADVRRGLQSCAQSRLEVEQLDTDSVGAATACAQGVMTRFPSIRGLVIDAKGLSASGHSDAERVAQAFRNVKVVFDALRPYFAAGARLLTISSRSGVESAQRLAAAKRTLLFQENTLEPCDLGGIANEFGAELDKARGDGQKVPCCSPAGYWLDATGFSFTLLHTLICIWHRKFQRLCFCTCACIPGENIDMEEAEAAVSLMMRPPAASPSLAGRLFENGGVQTPWVQDIYQVACS